MLAQLGDLADSALKRIAGVKDRDGFFRVMAACSIGPAAWFFPRCSLIIVVDESEPVGLTSLTIGK